MISRARFSNCCSGGLSSKFHARPRRGEETRRWPRLSNLRIHYCPLGPVLTLHSVFYLWQKFLCSLGSSRPSPARAAALTYLFACIIAIPIRRGSSELELFVRDVMWGVKTCREWFIREGKQCDIYLSFKGTPIEKLDEVTYLSELKSFLVGTKLQEAAKK